MSKLHREYFNALAPEWSTRMPDDSRFRELLVQFGICRGDRVLDAGTGTGRMTRHLTGLVGETGQVVAQDFAFDMVHIGQSNNSNASIRWLCDDLCALALKSNEFDKVLCFSIFPHIQDSALALHEIHRILKPGGKLLILHVSSRDQLNQFHASLQGVVKSDRLPSLSDFETYFLQARIEPVSMIDEEGLFWVEGRKSFH